MAIIGTAVAGALFAEGTIAFTLTAGIVDLGLSVGLSYVAKALMGNQQQATTTGNSGKLSTGGAVPRTFMAGVGQTAGSLVYVGTWGKDGKTPNAYLTFVIALSDYPVTSLEELWIDSVKVTIDYSDTSYGEQGFPVTEYATEDGDNNHLWVKFYDGSQTAVDGFLVEKFGAHPSRPWKAASVGKGVAYAVVTCQWNDKLFSGYPKFNFVLKGLKTYDIRKDTTVGGNGAQRWADTATWEWSDNAAVVAYTVIRGLSYGGHWFYGLQNADRSRLPYPEWSLAANDCDVAITNNDGSTEAQYRIGGEIPIGTKLSDTIQSFLTGCNGRLSEVGGIYKLRVGAASDPVGSFSDDDILSTEDQTASPLIALTDKINGITAKYPEPNQIWAQFDAPPLYNAAFEAADGNRRLLTNVNYDLVPYQRQVQRLMQSALNEHRRARKHTVMFAPWARCLEPGDVLLWTSARWGYDAKLVRADQLSLQPNGDVQVQFTEVDPTDYDWHPATDEKTPNYGSLTLEPPAPQQIVGWQAIPYTIYDDDGVARRPGIAVLYEGDLVDVQSVRVQVRRPGQTDLDFDGTIPYGDPATNPNPVQAALSGNWPPNSKFEVRGKFLPYSSRATLWSNQDVDGSEGPWLAVTTPDVRLSGLDIYDGIIDLPQLSQTVKDLQAYVGQQARDLQDQLLAIALGTSDQDLSNFSDKQTLRTELRSTADGITAAYTQAIVVATGPDSALVAQITSLQAEIDDAIAAANQSFSSQVTDLGGAFSVAADAITSVQALVDGVSADATFRASAGYTPGAGYSARIGLEARVGSGDAYKAAGIYFDVSSTSARVLIETESFVVVDPTGAALKPLVFQDGVLTLTGLRVDGANIVNLQVDWANITNINIDSATIGVATILESNISFGALTDQGGGGFSGTWTIDNQANAPQVDGWYTICTATVAQSIAGGLVSVSGSWNFANATDKNWRIWRSDGVVIDTYSRSGSSHDVSRFVIDNNPTTTPGLTYHFQSYGGGGLGGTVNLKALYWKR